MRGFSRRSKAPGAAAERLASLRRALVAVLEGDTDRAEHELRALVAVDSSDVELYLALGRLFRGRGEVGRAIRVHQNLLLRSDVRPPERLRALAALAEDYRAGGFLRRAVASYEEVLEREPRDRAALQALVELLAVVGPHERAIELARRLRRLERSSDRSLEARLWLGLAESERAEGRAERARKAVKRSLKLDPASAAAHVLLGELEAERGRSKAALRAWEAVPELDPRAAALVYPRLQSAYAAVDRPRDYEAFLRGILDRRPDDSTARTALARSLAERGAVDEGLAELRRVLDGDPGNLEARAALGRILLSEHRDSDAAKELGELLEVLERRGAARPGARS